MHIVIAGGTGFLGRALTSSLIADGHSVTVLTRGVTRDQSRNVSPHPSADHPSPSGTSRSTLPRTISWTPGESSGPWVDAINGAQAVVNLAGDSIGEGRWTAAKKARIVDSRVQATRSLATAVAQVSNPPAVFVSGSAVGYYGPRGDETVTEGDAVGSDFLADVCARWEAEAARVGSRTRLVLVRTGLVLDAHEGALPRMLLPFRFGAGGPLGSGRQYWPWIHRDDWVKLVRFALEQSSVEGPINATAPTPVTNAEFTRALGHAMHRPAFMPAPAFALRIALGEMADALLLSGQRAIPAQAERRGFAFAYRRLEPALHALLT